KLVGKDIPESLPQSLVPPSMRANTTTLLSSPPPQEPMNLSWNGTAASFNSAELAQKQFPPHTIPACESRTTLHNPVTSSMCCKSDFLWTRSNLINGVYRTASSSG